MDAGTAPEESSRLSKRVQLDVVRTKGPTPWWAYAIAAALVLLVVLTVGWLLLRGGAGTPGGGTSTAPPGPTSGTPPPVRTSPPLVTTPAGPGVGPVPDVRGDTRTVAESKLRAAGFVVRVQTVVDPTCNNLGQVIRQSPAGGTTLGAGELVTIVVGGRPPNPCP